MANACVFCGDDSTSLTNEHFPPAWVSAVLPTEPTHMHYRMGTEGDAPPDVWMTKAYDSKVKVVCRRCNNTWMSRIEDRAKSVLPTYLLGHVRYMRPTAQRTVATWSLKSAMMVEQVTHPRGGVIPAAHYAEFYERKQPPDGGVVVLVARRWIPPDDGDPWTAMRTHVQDVGREIQAPNVVRAVRAGSRFYRIIVALAGFVFQVVGHDMPLNLDIRVPPGFEPIWPLRQGFIWGEIALNDDQIDGLPYP